MATNPVVKFLETHPSLELVDCSKNSNEIRLDELKDDEEIWLCECPSTISVAELKNQKISFSNDNDNSDTELEFIVQPYVTEKYLSCITPDTHLAISPFIPKGTISIRRRLLEKKKPKIRKNRIPVTVPFPENLKQRHPLLGHEFSAVLEQSKKISNNLPASEPCVPPKRKKSKDVIPEIAEPPVPKAKSKKVKSEQISSSQEKITPMKEETVDLVEAKLEHLNDEENDLLWLSQI